MATFNGNDSNNTLNGTAADDLINGLGGNDKLNGLAGMDVLVGGAGADTLDGGEDSDTYKVGPGDGFDLYSDTGTSGADRIVATVDGTVIGFKTGFKPASGIEEISADGHAGVTIGGNTTGDVLDFSQTVLTGIVKIDGGAGNDTITGSAGADVIVGGVGNDKLNGLAGMDVLVGGAGADTLNGGEDSDTYEVGPGDGFDLYSDTGTSGADRIVATADGTAIGLKSGFKPTSGIEEISAGGHAGVTIQGGMTADVLDLSQTVLTGIVKIDGGAGNDTITGSAGDDVIAGGIGNDTLKGGEGSDTYEVGPGDGFDLFADTGASGTDRIVATTDNTAIGLKSGFKPTSGIEEISANGHTGVTIRGGNTNDVLDFSQTVLTGIVRIDGGAGGDTITGSAGADVIAGGTGNDTLNGGLGSDRFVVGDGSTPSGADKINGFTLGVDKIEVNFSGFTSFANVLAAAQQVGADTVITFGSGSTLKLTGIVLNTLTSQNFIFPSAANHPPVLTGDLAASVAEGGSYQITTDDLSFSDPDDAASGVTFTVSNLVNGIIKVNGGAALTFTGQDIVGGLVTFEHDGTEPGAASFAVSVEDGNEDASTPVAQPFDFSVTAVNDAPVSGGDASASGSEDDASIAGAVPAASDVDDEQLNYALVSGSVRIDGIAAPDMAVSVNADGGFSYVPSGDQGLDQGETRIVTFQYLANDGSANSAAAMVTITVNGANDAPVSGGTASASGTEDDASIGGTVPAASDVDIEPLTYALVSDSVTRGGVAAPEGIVTFNADGTFSYDPSADQDLDDTETRLVTFQYVADDGSVNSAPATVTITVNGANDAPVSGGDAVVGGFEDDASIGTTVPPASDVDVEPLTYSLVAGSVKIDTVPAPDGTVTFNSNGSFSYAPSAADQGLDDGELRSITFQYVASDGTANSAAQDVTIQINGLNDAPVSGGAGSASGTEDDASIGGTVLAASDVDVEPLTYALVSGSVTRGGVAAADGIVTFNANGTFSYNPAADQNLDDGESRIITFQYVANDGTANSSAATVTITVNGVNDAPVSGGDAVVGGFEDDASIGTTVPPASDVDVEPLTYSLVAGSVKIDTVPAPDGTVTFNSNGSFSYAPSAADQGLDDGELRSITFQYVASDGTANSAAQDVTIQINGLNDAPVSGGAGSASGTEDDASIGGTVLAASDVDVEPLTYALVSGSVTRGGVAAADGIVTFNANGTFSYNPAADQNLDDGESRIITFQYVANDGTANSSAATVTITVNGVNDAPVSGGDAVVGGFEDDASIGTTVPGASDVDGEPLAYALVLGSVTRGGVAAPDSIVTFNSNGTFSYNPAADQDLDQGETRFVTFQYVASDGTASSAPASGTIQINGLNDAPVLTGDLAATISEGGAYVLTEADLNFSDPDDGAGEVTFTVSSTVNGEVKIGGIAVASFSGQQLAGGLVSFVHDGSNTTAASFDVAVEDGNEDGSAPVPQIFHFTVAAVNNAPTGVVTISGTAAEDQLLTANTSALADADGLGTFSYQWLRDGAAISGAVSTTYTLGDADVGHAIRVVVSYTDGGGTAESITSAATAAVTNVNDLPTGTVTITGAAVENATLTADASAIADADGLGPFSYAWQRDGVGILGASATTYLLGDADVGHAIRVVVSFTDVHGTSESLTSAATAPIDNVNDAPVITSNGGGASASLSIPENTSIVTDVDASDPDAGTTLTYAIVGGADQARFNINASSGVLSFAPAPNFEAPTDANADNIYEVVVQASDGTLSDTQALSITVTNVNEAPNITSNGGGASALLNVAENSTFVTDVNASDPEGNTLTYSISGGVDAARFSINPGTGVLSFAPAPDYENPTDNGNNNVYQVTVQVSDGSLINSQIFNVTVTDVSETVAATIIDFTNLGAGAGFIVQGEGNSDEVGQSVAPAGDVNGDGFEDLIIGSTADISGGVNIGEAYVIFGSNAGFGTNVAGRQVIDLATLSATQGFIVRGDSAADNAGYSVSAAGDVNGDGFGDVIVGAPGGDDGGSAAGEAYVIFGSGSGFGTNVGGRQIIDLTSLSAAQGFIIQGDDTGDRAGDSVSSAGDVDGDGYDDLIVGARNGAVSLGEAYIVFGKASTFGSSVIVATFTRQVVDLTSLGAADGFIIRGDTGGDLAGISVSSAGDLNGDGYDDMLVGAPEGDDGTIGAGEAYAIFGGSSGFGVNIGGRQVIDLTSLSAAQGFIIQGDTGSDHAGFSVSSAGDVNGDGLNDVIVGAHDGDDGGTSAGEAYIVFGSSSGFGVSVTTATFPRKVVDLTSLSASQGFIIQGDSPNDEAGYSVSSAGDVNGDGFADLIVGAPFGDDGGADSGVAYVIFGKSSGFGQSVTTGGFARQVIDLTTLSSTEGFIIQGDVTLDWAGFAVSSAGDVNHDGYDDLLVGAPEGDDGGNLAGEAYIVFGGAFGASGTPVTTTGTAAAEIFHGGLGNDNLTGGGGADVFRSGAGNDLLVVADGAFRNVDGGNGTDTLKFAFAGTIDLGNLDGIAATSDRGKIAGIEILDFSNGAANTVVLGLDDLRDLNVNNINVGGSAGLDNVLTIEGEVSDNVQLAASEWNATFDTITLSGYRIYTSLTSAELKLVIDSELSVFLS